MDFDRNTGALIDNYTSAVQSVGVILSTKLYSLVMLREFGGSVADVLGHKLTPRLMAVTKALITACIDLWEPRFRVRRITVGGSVEELRLGYAKFLIEADWRPRGHLGDETVASVKNFTLSATSAGIVART